VKRAKSISILADRRGATAIEYGLLVALIAIAGISAFTVTGEGVEQSMTDAANALPEPGSGSGAPSTP
jgi:pilus assembly protein Flp/PilA